MDQNDLRRQIAAFRPGCEQERADQRTMLLALDTFDDVLFRTNPLCHFTASCWIVEETKQRWLMAFHRIYRAWSWCGGHADGEGNLLEVAQREAREETGAALLTPVGTEPVSLEVLAVHAHEKRGQFVPAHLHLNLTYLFTAPFDQPLRSQPDENSAVRWRSEADIRADNTEPHMRAVYEKLMARSR